MRTILVLVTLAVLCCHVIAAPGQYLQPMKGYIPVYIQNGETPLEEINLELAEAFHTIPSGRSASGHDSIMAEPEEEESKHPKKKHHSKRAVDWSQESFENEDDSLEYELQQALARPDQKYDRSIDLQILSNIDDKW